jgi:hypothetical protein
MPAAKKLAADGPGRGIEGSVAALVAPSSFCHLDRSISLDRRGQRKALKLNADSLAGGSLMHQVNAAEQAGDDAEIAGSSRKHGRWLHVGDR